MDEPSEGQPSGRALREFYERWHEDKQWREHPIEGAKEMERVRVLRELMQGTTGRCLVIGCGTGPELGLPGPGAIGMDIAYTAVQKAKSEHAGAHVLVGDAHNLPFREGSMDRIICSEVLEHVDSPRAAAAEMGRVLRDGGAMVATVPNWLSWWGAARKVAELILRRPVTAARQVVDNWFTPWELDQVIGEHLSIEGRRGMWYLPPTGYRSAQLPWALVAPVVKLFLPVERLCQRIAPRWGHGLAVRAAKRHD